MQTLHDRSSRPARRRWSPWLAVGLVVLLAAGGGIVYAATSARQKASVQCAAGASCASTSTTSGTSGHATDAAAKTMSLVSTSPASGATGVQPNSHVTVKFTTSIAANSPMPTIAPNVTGTWARSGDQLVFTPDRSLVPYTKYTVTIPGGTSGVTGVDGSHLRTSATAAFTVAAGSELRVQQLLAKLGYLPLTYNGATPTPLDMALPQAGTLGWKWSTLPSQLTDQWVTGSTNPLTKSAVMMFETENGLSVDGIAGPAVWTTLLADVAADKANTEPLTYVLVTKVDPEHLTAWVNGTLTFHDIPVNTGVLGATTVDGTFRVFEHVRTSDMKGTDVTGTKYTDPNIPWVSYFNGGDALHGYVRASYGFPQSNGCVEMKVTTAAKVWPYTPIGTLVTIQGPTPAASGVPSTGSTAAPTTTTTTTSTTAPPTTTTTTAPPTTTTTTTTTSTTSSTPAAAG